MIVTSGENTSSITITSISSGATVNVSPATNTSSIEVNKVAGFDVPANFEQRITDLENSWYHHATLVEYTGVDVVIATGDVLECVYDGDTLYRYITTAESVNGYPLEDSFYKGFDGTNLTGLIATRG